MTSKKETRLQNNLQKNMMLFYLSLLHSVVQPFDVSLNFLTAKTRVSKQQPCKALFRNGWHSSRIFRKVGIVKEHCTKRDKMKAKAMNLSQVFIYCNHNLNLEGLLEINMTSPLSGHLLP